MGVNIRSGLQKIAPANPSQDKSVPNKIG